MAIQITREGTTPEQKAALIKVATDLLAGVRNKPPGLTFVWSSSGTAFAGCSSQSLAFREGQGLFVPSP